MNTPQDILVITNGKAVIVPADKWPYSCTCSNATEAENCAKTCDKDSRGQAMKLEAIAQGAVVEEMPSALIGILFNTEASYPLDPSLWVVDKQWQYFDSAWKECTKEEAEYWKGINYASVQTRQIATIKPKAEDTAIAPTRKLVTDQLIEFINKYYQSQGGDLFCSGHS